MSFRGAGKREPESRDSGAGPSGHPGITAIRITSWGEAHMPTILGSGEHRYRVVENWAKLPEDWNLTDVASVAVDSKDRIYVFNRGAHPMVVLDREGNFITSWGEGLFNRAHGLHIDTEDNLYCTDDGDHTVRKCSTNGKVLLTIGIPNKPAPFMSGEPFHRCTHTALSPTGEIYVSDGYGDACVHKYTPSSISCTTSSPTPTAGFMSPTAKTIACRCSTATANTRRSGTICTGPARCIAAAAGSRILSSASLVRACRSIARCRIWVRASPSSTPRERASLGSAAKTVLASRPANSWRRTASRWIRRATSMSAKSALPTGRPAFRICLFRPWFAVCRNWRRSSGCSKSSSR